MIEVEMREHDVAHIVRIEPQPFDLADGGELLAKIRAQQPQEEPAQPAAWIVHVARAEAGVHQDQVAASLDEQAVATQRTARHHARCPAVDEPAAERA